MYRAARHLQRLLGSTKAIALPSYRHITTLFSPSLLQALKASRAGTLRQSKYLLAEGSLRPSKSYSKMSTSDTETENPAEVLAVLQDKLQNDAATKERAQELFQNITEINSRIDSSKTGANTQRRTDSEVRPRQT